MFIASCLFVVLVCTGYLYLRTGEHHFLLNSVVSSVQLVAFTILALGIRRLWSTKHRYISLPVFSQKLADPLVSSEKNAGKRDPLVSVNFESVES